MKHRRPSGMVAVLFTDLVGSTDLMTRLGAAAFDELRRAHFASLSLALERAGGEEIKNTGDGVMATFGSVVDAIRCAVAMQQATERQARRAGTPIAIRVGLSIGEATLEAHRQLRVVGSHRLERARMLLTHGGPGDAERARDLLGKALATARHLGLGNIERRAVALLQ